MRRNFSYVFVASLVALLLFVGVRKMLAQSSLPPSMVTQAVDDTQRVTLRGNVQPLARAENDQGAAPSTMQMNHMLLVLKRSPEQETALENLIAQQADKNSPNYQKWLTPAQFGQEFGASDQDITAITTWLGSHGFQISGVANGRNMIDFSGTVGEIQEAFHTQIDQFLVNGQNHFANVSDPQIPAALSPIIAGINRLNDFRPKAMHRSLGEFKMNRQTHKATRVSPQYTFPNTGCYGTNTACYGVGAYDFATIYNLLPLWNANYTGTGETIAVVSDSYINTADYQQFRTIMGLPAQTVNAQLATGVNPGIQNCSANSDEGEAILDVEWAGATAPGATIDLVMAPSPSNFSCTGASTSGEVSEYGYTSTFGGDYAAYYAVNTLNDPILSDSYGECELGLGTAGNAFYNSLWQQANTQGITVLTATGDNGSAGCDNPDGTTPAEDGLQVNGTASTPYDTAVGGTDFDYINNASTYWSSTNNSAGASSTLSVLGPIPETVYNDSCTNFELFSSFSATTAANACNSAAAEENGFDVPVGGSGGLSACTTPSGLATTDCSGGYAKPSWQTGTGVLSDGKRDIPDLSLFAGDGGTSGSFFIVCEEDNFSPATACNLSPTLEGTTEEYFFLAEGGTSVSTQAMAGIVADLDQYHGKRYGSVLLNTQLYTLANAESATNCNASVQTAIATSCDFRDITTGTNSQPCETGTTNCGTTISSQVTPIAAPEIKFRWTPLGIAFLICTLCAAMLLFVLPGKQRWTTALALVLFAALFGSVSCGGGSGNGTVTGGGGTTTTVGVLSGYNATTGYDRATGLGSINASNLIKASGW